jgi:catechol 2,3-dioxygenase-like lactoylglutathione lyase family enzyme
MHRTSSSVLGYGTDFGTARRKRPRFRCLARHQSIDRRPRRSLPRRSLFAQVVAVILAFVGAEAPALATPVEMIGRMLVGLGHVDLVCRDLRRSLAFYRSVFGPLGPEEPALYPGERGEQIHYLRFPRPGSGSIGLMQAFEEQEILLYAGFHHLTLTVDSRQDVDAAHTAAVAAGAEIVHAHGSGRSAQNPTGCRRTITPFFLDRDLPARGSVGPPHGRNGRIGTVAGHVRNV